MPSRSRQFAKKSLGQNFLTDQSIIKSIVDALTLTADDTVIEIGPGRGALTGRLIESGACVTAIELDRQFVPHLRNQFIDLPNFSVVEADALAIDFAELVRNPKSKIQSPKSARLVANLPYYISTAILQRLAEQRSCFSSLVLMFQREVVERITAKPGDSGRGFLTVIVEAAFSVERLFDVPPTAFVPVPKVWSSVVRLTPKPSQIDDEESFRRLVGIAFAHKRKTILNNLKANYRNSQSALKSSGIDAKRRAETLALSEWMALHSALERN